MWVPVWPLHIQEHRAALGLDPRAYVEIVEISALWEDGPRVKPKGSIVDVEVKE